MIPSIGYNPSLPFISMVKISNWSEGSGDARTSSVAARGGLPNYTQTQVTQAAVLSGWHP